MEADMSVAAITGSAGTQLINVQRNYQQVRSEFKQLGQDLQAGNLAAAQGDFVTLSQAMNSSLSGNSTAGKAMSALGQALQAGDLTGAKQAWAALRSATVGPCAVPHHAHVPPMQSQFAQALRQLGQALQSGDLTTAKTAFAAAQQSWQQYSGSSAV